MLVDPGQLYPQCTFEGGFSQKEAIGRNLTVHGPIHLFLNADKEKSGHPSTCVPSSPKAIGQLTKNISMGNKTKLLLL